MRTDMSALAQTIERIGVDNIVCVLSTSSCFAPRSPDKLDSHIPIYPFSHTHDHRIVKIARLCASLSLPHVVNNAYGVQQSSVWRRINRAHRVGGRIDAVVQSTDKNFLVPVGGALVFSPDESLTQAVSQLYPGRASAAPILDMFITLLSMGEHGLRALLTDREEHLWPVFQQRLGALAEEHGERLMHTPHNAISMAVTLDTYENPAMLGSQLFYKEVSGTRYCTRTVCGHLICIHTHTHTYVGLL